jgi:hypothetical protein
MTYIIGHPFVEIDLLPHVEGFDSLVVVRSVQLGKTKAIKHGGACCLLS